MFGKTNLQDLQLKCVKKNVSRIRFKYIKKQKQFLINKIQILKATSGTMDPGLAGVFAACTVVQSKGWGRSSEQNDHGDEVKGQTSYLSVIL